MTPRPPLDRLFKPRAVALVGVPGDLTRPGARPLHYLRRHGYPGRIHLVHPTRSEIGGAPTHPSLGAVPEPVDVAWIGLPSEKAAEAVRECGPLGIPFAIVLGAGFAESGEPGAAEQARLSDAARAAGVRLVGPNTVGFVNAWDRVALTFSTVGESDGFAPGPLAIVSQSGGLGGCLTDRAAGSVGLFVSTGNEADLSLADYLDWIVDDGRARVVACLIEQARDPDRVAGAVARARERGIAVLALKLGGSETGARAARSHTASLVGARDTWRAWARAAGLVEVRDLDELLEAARYVAAAPALRGDRAGLVTSSGGIAVLLADALEPRGFTFPALAPGTRERVAALLPRYATVGNPLDITAGLPDEVFGDVLAAMLADPGLDLLLVPLTMATADGGRARAEQVSRVLQGAAKPVAVFWPGGSLVRKGHEALEAAGVPLFTSVATCAAALGAARDLRCRRPRAGATGSSGLTLPAVLRDGALPWADVRAVLAAAGVRTAPEVVVTTEAEARRAAVGLAYPVAVKLLGPLHKTEIEGVRLGLATPEAMLAAVRELLPRGDGCLVQPMVEGVEVLVGALRDPALGAFVVLAAGGIHAELYGARAMRPVPLGPEEARGMLAETTALAALLAGHRGRPASDRESLLDVVVRVGVLAVALGPRLRELDLNPVIVGADGATVVDARIVLAA